MEVKFPNYIVYGPLGNVQEVLCKCCGAVLQSLVPDERFTHTKVVRGQIVTEKMLVLIPTNQYTEVTVEMWDGSAHVTPLCKECAAKLPDKLTPEVYDADVASWRETAPPLDYVQANVDANAGRFCYKVVR